jgi:hypothetical protein
MEFSAFAEKETSALIARILAESSETSRQRVEALRAALDSATRAAESVVGETPDTQAQVADLVAQLAKTAAAEADTRLKRLSSEARKITDSLRADLEEKTAEQESLEGSLKDALGQLEGVRAELAEHVRGKNDLFDSLAAARDEMDVVSAELSLRNEEVAAQASEKDALAAALQEAHGRTNALGAELKEEERRAGSLQQQIDAAHAEQQAIAEALHNATAAQQRDASARAELEAELQAAHNLIEIAQGEAAQANAALESERLVAQTLIEAAQGEAARALATLDMERHTAQGLLEAAQSEAARAIAALDMERQAAQSVIETAQAEARAKASLEPELHAAQGLLDAAQAEAAHARAELQAVLAEKGKVEHALGELTGHAQAAEAKLAATTTLFKTSSARVKLLEREREEHEDALHELQAKLEGVNGREVEVELTSAGQGSAVSMLDGLLGAFEALSSAATIGDVLSTLVEQLVNEFPRVALFRVKGNRLEGAHQIGFDLNHDIGKVMMPLAMDSLLTRAVSSGRTERVSGDRTDSSHLPFGGTPTCALAMPIVVDGEAMAVVYADDSGQARPDSHGDNDDLNARFAEALRHHAVALLTRLTSELKAMAELRAYAGSLVSETEQMYEADVAGGKVGDDLLKRLHANLDYARSIYANRVASEPASTAGLFDAQLAGTIDLHRENPFGRDLAIVAEWPSTAQPSARKAEAS